MKLNGLKVAIFGGGNIGAQFAVLFLQNGFEVAIYESNPDPAFYLNAKKNILNSLFFATKDGGRIFASNEEVLEAFSHLAWYEPTDENLAKLENYDAVIEAIVENLQAKIAVHQAIERCAPMVPHYSATSTVLAQDIADQLSISDDFALIHPSTPLSVMSLMEIIPHELTSARTIDFAEKLVSMVGKRSILAPDIPGFGENRVLFSMILAGFQEVENGADFKEIDKALGTGTWVDNPAALRVVWECIHSAEKIIAKDQLNCKVQLTECDIDDIMVSMAGFPMGPFALKERILAGTAHGIHPQRLFRTIDLVGLDVALHGLESLVDTEPERWWIPDLLKKMVAEGKLGEKSGEGFYTHDGNIAVETVVVPAQENLPEATYSRVSLSGKYLPSSMIVKTEKIIHDLEVTPNMKAIELVIDNMLGADVKEFPAALMDEDCARSALQKGHSLMKAIKKSPLPIITVASGKRVWGGACEVVLHGDKIIVEEKTDLKLPETQNVALLPGYGGTQALPRLIGVPKGLFAILTGESIDLSPSSLVKIVPEINWEDIGVAIAHGIPKRTWESLTLSDEQQKEIGRSRAKAAEFWKGHHPTSFNFANDAIFNGCQKPIEEGVALEVKLFLKALKTPEAEARVRAILFPEKKESVRGKKTA